jgi:CBS domain-containing protein
MMVIRDNPESAREDVGAFDHDEQRESSQLGSALLRETLKNALSNHGLVLDEQTPLDEALRQMREHRQGCVLATRYGRLSGIFTERDVLMKVVGTTIDLKRTPLRPYMTRDPLRLSEDAIVADALKRMCVEGFRHVPLTDQQGCPIGVVSMRDIIEYVSGFFPKDVLNLPPEPISGFRNREGA